AMDRLSIARRTGARRLWARFFGGGAPFGEPAGRLEDDDRGRRRTPQSRAFAAYPYCAVVRRARRPGTQATGYLHAVFRRYVFSPAPAGASYEAGGNTNGGRPDRCSRSLPGEAARNLAGPGTHPASAGKRYVCASALLDRRLL